MQCDAMKSDLGDLIGSSLCSQLVNNLLRVWKINTISMQIKFKVPQNVNRGKWIDGKFKMKSLAYHHDIAEMSSRY